MTRSELLIKLKATRKELADREGVELFMVFTNKALEETVKAMPTTLEDLALVKGWGKTKIAKYGKDILDIINNENSLETGCPSEVVGAVFSVSEFLEAVNITLQRLGMARIRGEVSELRHRGSVVYFTLKDASGAPTSIKCVLWTWKYEREYGYLEDGLEIVVEASSEVYAKYGSFDLRVERIEPVGEGALRKAFEALQKKLEAKGYFDAARKRPIPALVRRIGVITSEKGEAINDFLKNIGNFGFEIVLADARVEGDRAERSIVEALERMNILRPDLDVLCLIRGGGGLENLKAFNSELVVNAIVASRLPVLTGIGHERDITIAGLSSDADFSTPTKIADAIRRGREELMRGMERQATELSSLMEELRRETAQSIEMLTREFLRSPNVLLDRVRAGISVGAHRLDTALGRVFEAFRLLERTFTGAIRAYLQRTQTVRQAIFYTTGKIEEAASHILQTTRQRMAVAWAALAPLDPEAPLQRGYSIAFAQNGKVIKRTEDVRIGEYMTLRLHEGFIKSRVEELLNKKLKNKNVK